MTIHMYYWGPLNLPEIDIDDNLNSTDSQQNQPTYHHKSMETSSSSCREKQQQTSLELMTILYCRTADYQALFRFLSIELRVEHN
ncbi:hypothetical protein NC652_012362 [Populus alba x Populus x berolinensis]|nr:hypothetical protein NC652_012362 [Populus alba x Populus x berolinensis]